MEKMRKSTYWLFLIAMAVVLLTGSLFPEESYANMRSEAVWETGLQTSAVKVSADFLKEGGQNVLLWDLTQQRTMDLTFTTNRGSVNGTLQCSVSPQNAVSVQAPTNVKATAEGTKATLVLTPETVTRDTQVILSLTWTAESGEKLQGNFQFTVPASSGSTTESQQKTSTTGNATMSVMKQFASGAAIVVELEHPANCEKIALSLAGMKFPIGTRYSMEDGSNEYVLFDPAQISMENNGRKHTSVLITLPKVNIASTFTLQANVIGPDYETQLQAQTEAISDALVLPENYFYALSDGGSFTMPLPTNWSGCTLSYTVKRLTQTQQGIQYIGSDSQGLSVISKANGIVVSLTGRDMPAGTYQLLLVWKYQTYTVAQQEVTFHVSYPERSTVQTGGNAA